MQAEGVDGVIEAQVRPVRRVNSTYASSVRRFLTEYLGEGDDPEERVPFGGRDAELQALTEWLDDHSHRQKYLLMVARAGRGKSALLTRWLEYLHHRDQNIVIFVPISIWFETAAVSVFMSILASRLAELHGETLPDTPSDAEKWKDLCRSYLTRAIPNERRVVVILDGLDEAEQSITATNLLPSPDELATTVRIVLSARLQLGDISPVGWLSRLGLNPHKVKSLELQPLTLEGIKAILMKRGTPLSGLSYDHATLVREMHRITEGDPLLVNLYAKELLESGEDIPKSNTIQLSQIPQGLGSFFDIWRESIEKYWTGTDTRQLLSKICFAVQSLLAGAHGPIYVNELLELTLPETGGIREVLLDAMLPLNRFLVGDGKAQGFVFSHPRFVEYLWDECLSAEERLHWSQRFVSYGASVVQDLITIPPKKHPKDSEWFRYAVQYYREHLDQTDAPVESYYALLCQPWAEAWFTLRGTYDGFLMDVDYIWKKAREDTQTGNRVRGMSKEILCALCQSSIVAFTRNINPLLFVRAVEAGIYTPTQALVMLRQLETAEAKVSTIGALFELSQINESVQRELFEYACALQDEYYRGDALRTLTPHLALPFLEKALITARTIQDEDYRADTLRELAPWFEGDMQAAVWQEVLTTVRAIEDTSSRATALRNLVPMFEGDMRVTVLEDALAATRAIGYDSSRVSALCAIAPFFEEDAKITILQEALAAARTIQDENTRAGALHAITLLSEGEIRLALLQETVSTMYGIRYAAQRTVAFRSIAQQFEGDMRLALLQLAATDARAIQNENSRTTALCNIAQLFEGGARDALLQEAVMVACAIQDPSTRTMTLRDLMPLLEGDMRVTLLQETLTAARSIQNPSSRAASLRELATLVESDMRVTLLQEALATARTIPDDSSRSYALRDLAPLFEGNMRVTLLQEALSTTHIIEDDFPCVDTLRTLIPYFSPSLLQEALTAARAIQSERSRIYFLRDLAALVKGDMRVTILQEALTTVSAIHDESYHANALRDLALLVEGDRRVALLQEALTAVSTIHDESYRATALRTIAPQLPPQLLQAALTAARAIQNPTYRTSTLYTIASLIEGDMRRTLLEEMLRDAYATQHSYSRATVFRTIAPLFEEDVRTEIMQEALTTVYAIHDDTSRASALEIIASQLPPHLLPEALTAARALPHAFPRMANATFRRIVLHFEGQTRVTLLQEALTKALAIEDDAYRSHALCALIPHLPSSFLPEVLVAVLAIGEERYRTEALCTLAPHLPPPLLSEVLPAARAIQNANDRAIALRTLIPLFEGDTRLILLQEALAAARAIQDEGDRASALCNLAPLSENDIRDLLLQEALATAYAIHSEDPRIYKLRDVAEALHAIKNEITANIQWIREWQATIKQCATYPRPAFLQDIAAFLPFTLDMADANLSMVQPHILVDELLGTRPADEKPSTRLAGEIFKAIQDVTSWWP